jgi:hypothetical protein
MRARAGWGVILVAGVACVGYVPKPGPVTASGALVRVPRAGPESLEVRTTDSTWMMTGVTAVYGRVLHVAGDTLDMTVVQVGQSGRLITMPADVRASVRLAPGRPIEHFAINERNTVRFVAFTAILAVAAYYTVRGFLLLAAAAAGD